MKRKKICFVVSTISSANAFLKNHIIALKKEYDVYIVANLETERDFAILEEIGFNGYQNIKIVRKISIANDLKAVLDLSNYFKRMKFDAVHSLTPKAGLVCQLAALLAGIKIRIHIFTGQVWCNMKGAKRMLLIAIDKLIATTATNILVDGKSQKEFLVQNKVVSETKAVVLGQGSIAGIDSERYSFNENIRNEQRAKFGLPEEAVVFSFLGRLNRDKGVPELLEAFSKLASRNKNVFLILFGSDEENIADTFAQYPELKEKENFLFAGHVTKPHEALQVSDIFCLPSHREGFGVSVIEAESMSIPVICSDAYGLRDTIITGVTGLRHKVGDSSSLLEAMQFLLDNPIKRIEMGKKGREYVEVNFPAAKVTKDWVDYYAGLLNK